MKLAKGIQTITIAKAKEIINDKDKMFIDVRTPAEYKERNVKQFKKLGYEKVTNIRGGMSAY